MRSGFAAVLLIVAGAGEARGQAVDDRSFCATLRQLLGAAAERPAFASPGQGGTARAAAGLGFGSCRIVPDLYGNRIVCSTVAIPRYAIGEASEIRVARCVPDALGMSEAEGSRFTRFRLGTLAFFLERNAHIVTFTLFALPVER